MPSYEKRGNKWTVRFRIEDTNKRLSGFNTKKEAEQAYIKQRTIANKAVTDLTLEQLFELFKDYKRIRIKESSYLNFVQTLRDYVMPYFAKKKIVSITPAQISEWQNEIDKKPLKFRTKDKMYTTFVNLMNYAVEFYNLPFNPISKVGNFKNKELKEQMTFWTEQEFEQFIKVVDNLTYKAFFSTLYLTGARKGEVMALQWQDINFDNAIISITKTYTNKTLEGSYKLTTPKTTSSVRQILISDNLLKLLIKLQEEQKTFEGYCEQCFVFGFSRPLALINIDRNKHNYCKLAGVKEIRIHDFRHSHASLLLNKEQNIMLVAQRLGHSNINMTLNTYSHLFPNKQKEIISSLNIDLNDK